MTNQDAKKILTKISNNEPLCLSEEEFTIIEEMVDEGLIKPDNTGYTLTEYGKMIEVLGFEANKNKEIEKSKIFPTLCSDSVIIFLGWLLAIISILGCLYYLN